MRLPEPLCTPDVRAALNWPIVGRLDLIPAGSGWNWDPDANNRPCSDATRPSGGTGRSQTCRIGLDTNYLAS